MTMTKKSWPCNDEEAALCFRLVDLLIQNCVSAKEAKCFNVNAKESSNVVQDSSNVGQDAVTMLCCCNYIAIDHFVVKKTIKRVQNATSMSGAAASMSS